MRSILLIICCVGFISSEAQKIYPRDELIITKNAGNNRFCLFQTLSSRLVVFERNSYWFTDLKGNLVEGPFTLGSKNVEPEAFRLSPSGTYLSMNYLPEDVGKDRFHIIYDLVEKKLVNAEKIDYSYELKEISFASDNVLRRYSNNTFDGEPLNRIWDYKNDRQKYFWIDSSGNGYPDYTMFKHLLLFTRKAKDSIILNIADSSGKKYRPIIITNIDKHIESRFFGTHPCLYIKQNNSVAVYRFVDTTYQLLNTIEGNYDVIEGNADSVNCYLLLKHISGALYLYDAVKGSTQLITRTFHPKTIFQLFPTRQLLTASHPWNGSIELFSLATAARSDSISTIDPSAASFTTMTADTNVLQRSVSVLIRQSDDNTFPSFDDNERQEVIQVRNNKITFLDAASGCIKHSVFLEASENSGRYAISPSRKYLLSFNNYKDEKWMYPVSIHVNDVYSGKLVLNILSVNSRSGADFFKNDLLAITGYSDTGKTNYSLYDLATGFVKAFNFPKGFTELKDATTYKGAFYFLFQNDTSVLLQRGDGTRIFQTKIRKENSTIFFSAGAPYLFIGSEKQPSAIYYITPSSAVLKKKMPSNITILSANGTDETCTLYYKDSHEGRRYAYDLANNKSIPSEVVEPQMGKINTRISSIAYSPDGRYLATANPDGKVMLWDLGTGKETKVLKVEKNGYITQLCFTPSGDRLAASSGDIWETATGKNILSVTTGTIYNVNSIDVSRDGKYILSGGAYILLWDAQSGETLHSYIKLDKSAFKQQLGGGIYDDYPFMVHSTAFHPNSRVFATGNKKGTVEIFDIDTGRITSKNIASSYQGDQKIIDIKYSRDGAWIFALQKRTLYKLNSGTLNVIDSITAPAGAEFHRIDISYNDNLLADIVSCNGTETVELRKLDDFSVARKFSAPGAVFNKISFSPNKQHLATASDDGFCAIWDIATGTPVMYLNNIGEYGNVMVTPDNYYMASKSALAEVAFSINGEYYSFDQFDLYLNRPDIVLERLHYASPELIKFYHQAYLKRLTKVKGSADANIVYTAPVLDVLNRNALPATTKTSKHQLKFSIKDTLTNTGKLEVSINNNKVFTRLVHQSDSIDITADIELGNGKNVIEAVYINNNNVESKRQKINMQYTPVQPQSFKVWYIGIGVSKYKDSAMNLRYASKDIKDMAVVIRKKYPTAIIDTLLNTSATTEKITALKQKLLKTGINDKVIISFSGHGLVDDSLNWYFATYDIDFRQPKEKGLSYNTMQALLDGIPARQKLLLVDACHSGEQDKEGDITFANKETAMQKDVKESGARGLTLRLKNTSKVGLQNSFELMQELFANLQYGNGASVIAASGGTEYAFENDTWKNGVFTYSLLKSVRSKSTDIDEDGIITVAELKKAIFESVKQLTGGRQKPTSRVEAYEDWVVW